MSRDEIVAEAFRSLERALATQHVDYEVTSAMWELRDALESIGVPVNEPATEETE